MTGAWKRQWVQGSLILGLILLLRVPFLNQAIQGDDFYYLKGAERTLVDPLHPSHARFIFQGVMVDMRGHPHPPLNAWFLGLLIRIFGGVREVPFHAAYILFSILAGLSAWSIALRFAKRPLLATVLFLVTPAFVVNGNSLESDLPFLAFWLAAVAAFLHERWWISALSGALAALAAYQAILLAPVLVWWLFMQKKRPLPAWTAVAAAPIAIASYQLFERLTSGALPASMLAGYMQTYNLQAAVQKLKNAAALTGHMGWIVFPVLALLAFRRGPLWTRAAAAAVPVAAAIAHPNPTFWICAGVGALVIFWSAAHARRDFLAAWVVLFFAAALLIFFAGSVRYLLPLVLPVSILVSDRLSSRWLIAGVALQTVLALALAAVNYRHWDGYRDFARSLAPEIARHRTWTNAEWGLRHYLEAEGAMPVEKDRALWPGDLLITSVYAAQPQGAGTTALIAERIITSAIPLRIVAPGADSAYSSTSFGLAPFAFSTAPVDTVRAALIAERKADLSALEIGAPESAPQIISGLYNNDRWTSGRATVLLKHPPGASKLEARIFIPPQAPGRTVRLYVDGNKIAERTYAAPGTYVLGAPASGGDPATVTLEVDQTFNVPPDARQLGIILLGIGYR